MLLNYQILTFQNRGSKIRSKAQISGCRTHVHCPLWRRPAVPQISRDSRSYCEVTKERRLSFVGGFNSDKEMYLDELSQTVPFLLKWVFTISKIKDQKYLHHNQSLCSDFSLCHSWALRVTFIVGVCWSRCSTHLKSNDAIFRRQLALNFQT